MATTAMIYFTSTEARPGFPFHVNSFGGVEVDGSAAQVALEWSKGKDESRMMVLAHPEEKGLRVFVNPDSVARIEDGDK